MSRRRRGADNDRLGLVCAAFGAGILLACFFSLKAVVVLAGFFLVVLGLRCR